MAKKIANENPIEAAERILAELQARHDKTVKARENDDRELGSVSYSALATGDKDAAEKLEHVKELALRRDLEIKAIRSAIAQAQQNLVEAKADAAAADQRRVALEVRTLLKSLRDAGAVCDEALATFAASSNVMKDIIQKMNALGFHHPSSTQYMSLGERAVRGTLVNTPFQRGFESIAPRERKNFNEFVGQWCISIEREIAARLGETKQGGGEKAA
jgi:hypothetical protein